MSGTAMGPTGGGRALEFSNPAALTNEGPAVLDIDAEEAKLTKDFNDKYEYNTFESEALKFEQEITLARAKVPYERVMDEYASLWAEMALRKDKKAQVDAIVDRIASAKDHYIAVQQVTKVPWYVVSIIHSLEAGLRFDRHLHNGDPLTARTLHVPAGRPKNGEPPFSWMQSAIDALTWDGLTKQTDWSIEHIAYILEGFNGWGYRLNHPSVKSPYLWSFSNHYSEGKYVADGKWDPNAVSRQCGAMVILRGLADRGLVRFDRVVEKIVMLGLEAEDDEPNYFEDDGGIEDNPEDDPPSAADLTSGSDASRVRDLIQNGSTASGLRAARLEAARRLSIYPTRGCAAHLSALLRQSGIMVPFTTGAGRIARELMRRGWTPVSVGQQRAGDVGVTRDDDPRIPGPDHVYLVIQTLDRDLMMIADNQRKSDSVHKRYASGRGRTPTEYFLRAT